MHASSWRAALGSSPLPERAPRVSLLTFPFPTCPSLLLQRIFPIIDRKSQINASDPTGETCTPSGATSLQGSVQIQGVTFAYPARPSVIVFRCGLPIRHSCVSTSDIEQLRVYVFVRML